MITGFERETHDLTDDEKKLVDPISNGLTARKGKRRAITSREMIKIMNKAREEKPSIWPKLNGARLRKVVNYIRISGKVRNLVATSKGYYIADTPEEIEKYKTSLEERIASIQAVRNSFD